MDTLADILYSLNWPFLAFQTSENDAICTNVMSFVPILASHGAL